MNDTLVIESACSLLDAMSHPARLKALLLVAEQEWIVGDLAKEVGISQSALSQHLKRLRRANLVRSRRDAQKIFYRCDDPTVSRILTLIGLRQDSKESLS